MESSYSYRIYCHHQSLIILQKHVHYRNSDKHGQLITLRRMLFVPRHAQILTWTGYLDHRSQQLGHSGKSFSTPTAVPAKWGGSRRTFSRCRRKACRTSSSNHLCSGINHAHGPSQTRWEMRRPKEPTPHQSLSCLEPGKEADGSQRATLLERARCQHPGALDACPRVVSLHQRTAKGKRTIRGPGQTGAWASRPSQRRSRMTRRTPHPVLLNNPASAPVFPLGDFTLFHPSNRR